MSICLIDPDNPAIDFPDIEQAAEDPNGLLAIGGNLSVDNLLRAYRSGVFPWYDQNSPILWWSPDPREILLRGDQHWSRSMRNCLLYTSPSPRDQRGSRMPSSA